MNKCEFCGRSLSQESLPGSHRRMCRSCQLAQKKLSRLCEAQKNKDGIIDFKKKTPLEIKKELDEFIIGQEETKRLLSVEIVKHQSRIAHPSLSLKKDNIFIVGPSGSGKTLLFETMSKIVDIPLVVTDATTYTEVGFVGKDVHSCLGNLVSAAKGDISLAQVGIIYIDEADKIATKKTEGSCSRDIRGEGVQQAFLKMIEGSDIEIEITDKDERRTVVIDTRNILFAFGGTFDGIGKIVRERSKKIKSRTLMPIEENDVTGLAENSFVVEPEDLIRYGFIKEFVGRVPLIVTMERLSPKQLYSILIHGEKSIVSEFKSFFESEGVALSFDSDALEYVVERSFKYNLGARGLRGVMSKKLSSLLFDLLLKEQKDVKITRCMLEKW